jgi:hypothetical protein
MYFAFIFGVMLDNAVSSRTQLFKVVPFWACLTGLESFLVDPEDELSCDGVIEFVIAAKDGEACAVSAPQIGNESLMPRRIFFITTGLQKLWLKGVGFYVVDLSFIIANFDWAALLVNSGGYDRNHGSKGSLRR